MRRISIDRTMPLRAPALAMLCAMAVGGCVSTGAHTKTLTELEAAKKTSAQLQQQLAGLQENLDKEATQRKAAEQQAAALAKERESLMARSEELNSELGTVRSQITDLEQKRASGNTSSQEEIAKLQKQASELEANAARIAKEREQLRQEQSQLAATLEQERLAKEEEIKRLTRTQEELSKSLQDEISKGNITIQQVRDRLTINMVDRVLFDSGQAHVKPTCFSTLMPAGFTWACPESNRTRSTMLIVRRSRTCCMVILPLEISSCSDLESSSCVRVSRVISSSLASRSCSNVAASRACSCRSCSRSFAMRAALPCRSLRSLFNCPFSFSRPSSRDCNSRERAASDSRSLANSVACCSADFR